MHLKINIPDIRFILLDQVTYGSQLLNIITNYTCKTEKQEMQMKQKVQKQKNVFVYKWIT